VARSKKPKKKLFVDFDGVIHSYGSGWKGPANIPDPPVVDPETGRTSIEWLTSLLQSGHFVVHIYSRRAADPSEGGIQAMANWLLEHGLAKRYLDRIEWETHKPEFFLMIDDRCHQFGGEFPEPWDLDRFEPWHRRRER
jgi:hypothetical protein